ncbi:MAG TPA: tetratricopeptide repeat protein [Myxococcales bacterium]|nr:tetratricopeptide repeat protein [Myxococcales bacterium]
MRKLLVIAALVACAHAEPPKPPPAQVAAVKPVELTQAEELLAAQKAIAAKQWDEAQAHLDRLEPKDAKAWFAAGWVAEQRKDVKAAKAAYTKVLELEPGQAKALNNLVLLVEPDEAEKLLRAALKNSPDDPRLLNSLASVQRDEKKLEAAAETVQRVLSRHPQDADAYRNLAAVESDRGHLRLAESALQSARKLDAKDPGISNSLGLLAMRRDDVAAAKANFEEAVKLDPGFGAGWVNLAALALRYRDYPAAEASSAKALAIDGSRWETHLAHGWALAGLKKPKEARAEYEQVLALQPAQEDALYGRALALRAEGDLPNALQAFKEYAANDKATHLKEAQGQVVQIELRLKNPPPQLKAAVKPVQAKDLTTLPQGTDVAPPASDLPTEEAAPPGEEKPAVGADGGVENETGKAGSR